MTRARTSTARFGASAPITPAVPTRAVAGRNSRRGPYMSIRRPTTGWPTAVARYSEEISHAVAEAGSPNATPIGTSATAMIVELIGFSTAPEISGASSARSNPSSPLLTR